MNVKKMTNSKKVIIASWLVAVFSLFLTWVDAFFFKANGFQQEGYFLLIFFFYPLIVVFLEKEINKIVGYISSGVGFLTISYFISTKSMEAFGEMMHFAAIGMYVFLAATLGLIVGVYLAKNTTEEIVVPLEKASGEVVQEEETVTVQTEKEESDKVESVLYGPHQLVEGAVEEPQTNHDTKIDVPTEEKVESDEIKKQ